MLKKIEKSEGKKLQEKYREEFKAKFIERLEKGEIMAFT
jgi:hypothetical protein|tara:strand:+ start:270 stop:386 length:117 start_codon:yes stop_codon:yes gene_type:complete